MAINTIDAKTLSIMFLAGAKNLEIKKEYINELNVFPVPDGDTGTNMCMTIMSAAKEVSALEDGFDFKALAKAISSGSLRGARGNSGVILSLLMRGISKKLKDVDICDGVLWAAALQEGVDAAYKAVMKPAEGTILTVARLAAAKATQAAQENNYFEYVHEAAIAEAKVALAGTTDMNPVLKKAGVVDAGGKGYLLILEGMLAEMRGEPMPEMSEEGKVQEKADFAALSDEEIILETSIYHRVRTSKKYYIVLIEQAIVVDVSIFRTAESGAVSACLDR